MLHAEEMSGQRPCVLCPTEVSLTSDLILVGHLFVSLSSDFWFAIRDIRLLASHPFISLTAGFGIWHQTAIWPPVGFCVIRLLIYCLYISLLWHHPYISLTPGFWFWHQTSGWPSTNYSDLRLLVGHPYISHTQGFWLAIHTFIIPKASGWPSIHFSDLSHFCLAIVRLLFGHL